MAGRHYVPCRRCGKTHQNPASSSLCEECGPIERLENIQRNAEIEEMGRISQIISDQNEDVVERIQSLMSSEPYVDVHLEKGLVRRRFHD